jgi:hypothetical protein
MQKGHVSAYVTTENPRGFRDEKFLEPGALVRARRGGAASDSTYIVGLVFESL